MEGKNISIDNKNGNMVGVAVGDNNTITVDQPSFQNVNLAELAEELSQIIKAMKEKAVLPEHYISMGELASAEQAATKGDKPKLLEHLRNSGEWALNCAKEIGSNVATELIKTSLGM